MHIPPASQRQWGVSQQSDEDYHPAQEQDKRRFAALLIPAASKRVTSANTISLGGLSVQVQPFHQSADGLPPLPCWQLKNLLTSSWLRWRLTNGPLAGLEIEACSRSHEMHIRLRLQDLAPLLKRLGSARQLEEQLSRQFNCPVTVEINDAHSGFE